MINKSIDNKSRILDIDLRVGDYQFDNTHIIRGNPFNFGSGAGSAVLPFDNDKAALTNAMWFATDNLYKNATERYQKALTNKAVKVAEEDSSADFSKEPKNIDVRELDNLTFDAAKWEKIITNLSAVFASEPLIYNATVSINTELKHKFYVSTEGTTLRWSEKGARIMVSAKTKAEDGMSLPLYESYFAFNPDELPDEATIANDIRKMIKLLVELREAPVATTFTGPAILSGEASGVFFHEIFGHRVEGHREKDPNSSQTFKQSIGQEILPDFIDVVFDPTLKKLNGIDISGYYPYDDEGVKAQRVETVKDGKFSHFLMSRSPIEGFANSNGHGRKEQGYNAVSRQSNLIVESAKNVTKDELKEKLRNICKEQGKDYGLYFVTVSGGFTFTNRTIPNAFNVTPLVVYKIYVDGRPDELVRGVDLIGTPLTTFSNIVAAADDLGVFNGICGAESGGVPVSACSPSLLVSTIEVQKKKKSQAKPPILPSPVKATLNP
jgi:predicted Zn-dependent protease